MRFRFPKIGRTWLPTNDDPVARFYRADVPVTITSASSATRHRAGTVCQDMGVEADDGGSPAPVDGQGIVELASGRLVLAGGAPNGHAVYVTNALWYSDDRGHTWDTLLADGDHAGWVASTTHSSSTTRPEPAHTFGFFRMTYGGVDYVYWIGGDPFLPTGRVFRIPAAQLDVGGTPSTSWTLVSSSCPTSGLALFMYGVLGTTIYIIGGQVDINDGAASKKAHKSTDGGATWTEIGTDIVPADVWGTQVGALPELDGKLWICGSARYDGTVNDFSNGVFSFNGTTFTEVLADGHAQFPSSRYHSAVEYEGKLWRFNGTTWDGVTLDSDSASAHYSADGVTWTEWTAPLPFAETHAQAAIATSDGIYLTDGFQSNKLHAIREHTGPLVSAWEDQGDDGLDLLQATDAEKPIYDVAEFNGRGGLVFTLGQFLALASKDATITDGFLEIWICAKTLSFDASAEQGPNPPCVLVGATDGSSYSNFGVLGPDGELQYKQVSGGYQATERGTGYNDDEPRLFGLVHQASSLKFYVGTEQVGATDTTDVGFDATHTGWNAVGAGYLEADKAAMAVGFVLVRTTGAVASSDFISRLATFAARWGA